MLHHLVSRVPRARFLIPILFGIALATVSALLPPFVNFAQAKPPLPESAIESVVGRFFFRDIEIGRPLIQEIVGPAAVWDNDAHRFLTRYLADPTDADLRYLYDYLRRPEMEPVRTRLEERIEEVRKALNESRVQRAYEGKRLRKPTEPVAVDEINLLRKLAKEFRVNESWRSPDPQAGEIDFVGGSRPQAETFASESERLRAAREELDFASSARPMEEAPPALQEEAEQGLIEWYKESQTCMRSRPKDESRRNELRYTFEQMKIGGSITTVSQLLSGVTEGIEKGGHDNVIIDGISGGYAKIVSWAFLFDMFIQQGSTFIGNKIQSSQDTFSIRWVKVWGWDLTRAKFDAELYQILPWKAGKGIPEGVSKEEAAYEREMINYAWNTTTSPISPLLFTILNGAECLIKEKHGAEAAAKFANRAFWGRTMFAVSRGGAYYYLRKKYIGQ